MKTKLAVLTLVVLLAGCKGDKGEKGDKGDSAQTTVLTGNIISDTQVISVPKYRHGTSGILVYGGNSTDYYELPIFNTAGSFNVLFVATDFVVTIYNGSSGGFTKYKIVVVNQPGTAGFQGLKETLVGP